MLNHQNNCAQVKPGSRRAQLVPDFRTGHEVIGLFPEMHLGQCAVIPAVADNAVPGGRSSCQVIGLRRACDSGESGHDARLRPLLPEARDVRHVRADQGTGQSDNIDDSQAGRHAVIIPIKGTYAIFFERRRTVDASHYRAERQETGQEKAQRCEREELQRRGWRKRTWQVCPKGIKAKWRWRADCGKKQP